MCIHIPDSLHCTAIVLKKRSRSEFLETHGVPLKAFLNCKMFGPNLFYEISVTFVENSVLLISEIVASIN